MTETSGARHGSAAMKWITIGSVQAAQLAWHAGRRAQAADAVEDLRQRRGGKTASPSVNSMSR